MRTKNILAYSLILITVIFIYACNSGQSDQKAAAANQNKICYRAIDKDDTAYVSLDVTGTLFTGDLKLNYKGRNADVGTLKGQVKGDTLIGDFNFKSDDVKKWYRNPVAFLKKGDSVIMGVGEIETAWGITYFKKHRPIDYDKGRFRFIKVDCK